MSEMDKKQAIQLANQSTKINVTLTDQNCHFSNINKSKKVWWLNIPEIKFDRDLFILLKHENMLSVLSIPANTFSQEELFRHQPDKNCVDLEICSDSNSLNYMHDTKSGGSSYDFRKHLEEQIHL